ncbi:hypothetical protein BH23ACT2_BH23ACT2_15530 [soil metagenome]
MGERATEARRALGAAGYAPLWDAARRRLEGNGRSLGGTSLRLDDLTGHQRRAISGLVGRSAAGHGPVRIRLDDLDERLRTGAAGIGLLGLLGELGGPVRDRAGDRVADRTTREAAWAAVLAHPVLTDRPTLVAWVASLRRSGVATRLAGSPVAGATLTGVALDVVSHLPATPIPLASLAAEVTTDAHALDRGRPLGTLVVGALAGLDAEDDAMGDNEGGNAVFATDGAAAWWWRRRWARHGVICDDLSVSVLALNLPVPGSDGPVASAVSDHASVGEPIRLTLRQLDMGGLTVEPGSTVHLCENPSVVAQAAMLLGERARPLVCVEGQPNSALHALLELLAAGGASFCYHGDFDWGGLRIATAVMDRYGAEPWRYRTADYDAAAPNGRLTLAARPSGVRSPWDPGLVEAMEQRAVAIHEEQVLDGLVEDLAP